MLHVINVTGLNSHITIALGAGIDGKGTNDLFYYIISIIIIIAYIFIAIRDG